MAVFQSAWPHCSTTFVLICSILLKLPERLHGDGPKKRLSIQDIVKQTFPPGARILVDEDGTCARARLYEWHMYRETAKGLLESYLFQTDNFKRNWHEQLNWWYSMMSAEMKHPPKVIECPIGRIFFSVLSLAVDFPGDHQFMLEYLLNGPWYINYTVPMVVLSGWPIFSLLSQMTRSYSDAAIGHPSTSWCPYQRLLEIVSGQRMALQRFLRVTRARLQGPDSEDGLAHKSARLALTVAEMEHFEHTPPDFILPRKLRLAIASLPRFAEIAGALLARNSTLSALLGVVQSWFLMQSGCVTGARLISARPENVLQPFRLCVRRKMVGLDAAATLFGEWPTCSKLRQWHRDFVGPLPLESERRPETPCVVVDVGSHVGLCSVAFAAQGCRVVAIDILTENAKMIFDSAQLNNIPHAQLTVVNAAVSDVDGGWVSVNGPGDGLPAQNTNIGDVVVSEQDLEYHSTNIGEVLVRDKEDHSAGFVPRQTVDALLRRVGIDPQAVTLLKVDAEGHDLKVLRGAMETLMAPRQHRRPFVCDEVKCNEEPETEEEAMLSPKKLHANLRGQLAIEPPLVVFECIDEEGGLQIIDQLNSVGMITTRKNRALNYAMRLHQQ